MCQNSFLLFTHVTCVFVILSTRGLKSLGSIHDKCGSIGMGQSDHAGVRSY